MGWNSLRDPRTAPGFGRAAVGGVVLLTLTGIYGWYAHLHLLSVHWDAVVVVLVTMIGFVVIGARSPWLLCWLMFPLWLSDCQMDAVDTPLFRVPGDSVAVQGLQVHGAHRIEVVIRTGSRGSRDRSRHIFAPVAPPDWQPGDPVPLWAHAWLGEFADPQHVLDDWTRSYDRVIAPSRKTELALPPTFGPFAEQARARLGAVRPLPLVQWRRYEEDMPQAAVRALAWPVIAMSLAWLLLVRHARRRMLRAERQATG